jgi:hypothetical protein
MRHPMDFWKGLTLAMAFITVVYIMFGIVVSYFCFHPFFTLANNRQCSLNIFPFYRFTQKWVNTPLKLLPRLSRPLACSQLAMFWPY